MKARTTIATALALVAAAAPTAQAARTAHVSHTARVSHVAHLTIPWDERVAPPAQRYRCHLAQAGRVIWVASPFKCKKVAKPGQSVRKA
jgi:hypothetical protein